MEITAEILKKLAPLTKKAKRDRFLPFLNDACPRYRIDTTQRLAAFLATICFESDYFKATEEYADGWDYDKSINPRKAKELGNDKVGDGPKYKGHGLIQVTGKYNHEKFKNFMGLGYPDFVSNPGLLAEPKWAVESACWFWERYSLNTYADESDFSKIQGIVNRGNPLKKAKAYPDRLKLYNLALTSLPTTNDAQNTPNTSALRPLESPVSEPVPQTSSDVVAAPATQAPPISINNNINVGGEDQESSGWWDRAKGIFTWYKDNSDTVEGVGSKVSKSSIATTLVTKVGGWTMLAIGVFQNYWLEMLIGAGLITLAVYYWKTSKDRQTRRILAFQDPGASK